MSTFELDSQIPQPWKMQKTVCCAVLFVAMLSGAMASTSAEVKLSFGTPLSKETVVRPAPQPHKPGKRGMVFPGVPPPICLLVTSGLTGTSPAGSK